MLTSLPLNLRIAVSEGVPPELAMQRYNERSTRSDYHQVHVERTTTLDAIAEYQRPMDLGPVIEVDTSGPVDVASIARLVEAALTLGQ